MLLLCRRSLKSQNQSAQNLGEQFLFVPAGHPCQIQNHFHLYPKYGLHNVFRRWNNMNTLSHISDILAVAQNYFSWIIRFLE